MSRIIFNLAAKCDRAGRSQNQDNYWVCPDLAKWNGSIDNIVGTDEDVELSDKGALLVVADGMGGMNAGEVASKLVIEGIKKKFSNVPDSILIDETEIISFIRRAIVESDESIKQYAKEHKEAEGLGSTIVLLWLLNGQAYCGWCGDSRIYRFNPNNELVRLSHDHSYVQSLVDEGKITEDEAFEHPDSNIISKSLGDNGNKADPEIRVYDIYSRDVFMLCSDGLCGLLQDSELNEIISRDCTSSKETLNYLWQEGEKAGWSDNATIDVLCIVDGGKPAKGRPDGYPMIAKKPIGKKEANKPPIVSGEESVFSKILKPPYLYICAILAICIFGIALYNTLREKDTEENTNHEFNIEVTDDNNTNNGNGTNTSSSNGNQNGGDNHGVQHNPNNGNTNGGKPSRNSTNHGGRQGNSGSNNHNNQSSSNNSSNQGSQNNGTNGGINQGVIDQINQNGHNDQNNHQQQQPSNEYMQTLFSTRRDYENIYDRIWPIVLKEGNIADSERDQIRNFITNVRNLTAPDNPSFKCLEESLKSELSKWLLFANNLERQLPSIPRYRENKNDNYNNNNDPFIQSL